MFGPESQADQPGWEPLEEWKAGEQANWNGRPQGGVRGADIGGSKNLNRIANSRPPPPAIQHWTCLASGVIAQTLNGFLLPDSRRPVLPL